MSLDELLAITPELLAKSILHRRERLAEVIPEQLGKARRIDEALSIATAPKDQRRNKQKISNLKKERNDFQRKQVSYSKKQI